MQKLSGRRIVFRNMGWPLLLAFFLLAGCKSYVTGYVGNASLLAYGEGDIKGDVTDFDLEFEGIDLECEGHGEVSYKAIGVIGTKFDITMKCNDGRTAKGETLVTSFEGA